MGRKADVRLSSAVCLRCDKRCKAGYTQNDAHRMWATRHAASTGHSVLLNTNEARIYGPKEE